MSKIVFVGPTNYELVYEVNEETKVDIDLKDGDVYVNGVAVFDGPDKKS